jgi:hypothetical protein
MTSRCHFLAASAAVGLLANRSKAARTTSSSGYPFAEFEARIAKNDFRDMTKDILPTPCMVVDLDMHVQGQHQAHGRYGEGQRH